LRPWGEIGQTRHNANLPHGIAWNLASMPPEAPFVVLEMAVGRMRESAKLARPTVAIVTNVTAAHLKYHGTVEEIARRKARMFEGMEPGAYAILNRDMPQWAIFADAAGRRDLTIHGYGRHPDADVRLIAYDPATRRADIGLDDRTLSIVLGAPGEHMALNACACIAALRAMAVPVEPSLPMFGLFQAVAGRGAISDLAIGARRLRLIDEAYNANPASMAAAIRLVREVDPPAPEGRRILILGDMLELGPDSAALHAALAPDVLAARPDLTLLCGPDMAALHAALPDDLARAWVPDIASLLTQADTLFADGDLVLVKSSGGTKLSALVSALKAAASVAA
jgi:UDP-N-acetylmuramyl pentapeptide synthase